MSRPCEELVREIVADHLGHDFDEVTLDAELTADLGADDLDLVEIVLALDETFGTEISDEEMEGFTTVASVVSAVEAKSARPVCPHCGSPLDEAAPTTKETR